MKLTRIRSHTHRKHGKQLRLKWFAPYAMGANITNYTIYSNTTIPIRVFPADGELTAYFSSLTPDTAYGFYITANNSEGESPRSPLAAFKTDLYVPDAVTEFVDPPVPPLASLPTATATPDPALHRVCSPRQRAATARRDSVPRQRAASAA